MLDLSSREKGRAIPNRPVIVAKLVGREFGGWKPPLRFAG